MISAILFFLGITLVYTGFLVSGSGLITGLIIACIGLLLIVKPALSATRYFMTNFAGGVRPRGRTNTRRAGVRKVHIKIVKSEDDKPTVH